MRLRTLCTGIFLYALGGFIRRYDPFKHFHTYALFLTIFAIYVLIWISSYNVTANKIERYFRDESTDDFIQSIPTFANYSIVVIIIGSVIFEIFRRIPTFSSKIINFLGQATFMVYLIHDNGFFYSIWDTQDWITTLYYHPYLFIAKIILWTCAVFAIGIITYVVYLGIIWLYKKQQYKERK